MTCRRILEMTSAPCKRNTKLLNLLRTWKVCSELLLSRSKDLSFLYLYEPHLELAIKIQAEIIHFLFLIGFVNHSIFVALVFSFGFTLLWRTVCRGNKNPILATDTDSIDLSKVNTNSINSGYLPASKGILVLCRSNISTKKLSLDYHTQHLF